LLVSFVYLVVCRLLALLVLLARGDRSKELEILVLRHELAVLRRQIGRPRFEPRDRLMFAAFSRVLSPRSWRAFPVRPETLWGDVDEPGGRWRVRARATKTRRARWVPVHDDVFAAVAATVPREDRDLEKQVFDGLGADRLRTAITRACKAAGIPAFSPHDLRHRRATLWHLQGVPVADAAAWLGHSPQEHLRTYAHATLADRSELDYPTLLFRSQPLIAG
jgi:hypothetical protein